jgi:hypothetical protein
MDQERDGPLAHVLAVGDKAGAGYVEIEFGISYPRTHAAS